MSSMSVNDSILGDLSQPQMERHHGVAQIILQPTIGFHKYVLNNIADIDPILDPFVQSHSHHLPDRITMPIHQSIHR